MIAKGIVVGRVGRVERHPDADYIRLAYVDLGQSDEAQIVFRSHDSLEAGQLVPVAPVGAQVATRKKKLRLRRFRGQLSHGMFCDLVELGWATDCPEEVTLLSGGLEPGDSLDGLSPEQQREIVINEPVPGHPIMWADDQTALRVELELLQLAEAAPLIKTPSGSGICVLA